MRKAIIILALLSIISVGYVVRAEDSNSLEAFYAACVDQKIAQCEGKVRLAGCSSETLRSCGEDATIQVSFYSQNKQKLIAEMMKQDIGLSKTKAEYFLIKAHQQFLTTQVKR